MKTSEQIVAKLREIEKTDVFGFESGDLVGMLPYEHAKPFLKDGTTAEQWDEVFKKEPKTDDDLKIVVKDYLVFAWGKANHRRGLSAMRSISHFSAWMFLLGEDDLQKLCEEDYQYYGKAILREISERFGVDWKSLDDGEWANSEAGPFVKANDVPRLINAPAHS